MIVAADLGNGHTDLIISEGAAPTRSSCTWATATAPSSPAARDHRAWPEYARIEAANLGDGHVDVAALVAASSGNGDRRLHGDGTGNLPRRPVPLPGGAPQDLVVAPLTNGGRRASCAAVDTGNKTTSLSELLNNGSSVSRPP